MSRRYLFFSFTFICLVGACKTDIPVEPKKPLPAPIVKTKRAILTAQQRQELAFPPSLIAQIELAAGSEAEPFFITILMHTENLKGEQGYESKKLAGISVHTRNADELIDTFRTSLRTQGYLIFKSQKGFGNMLDITTVIKGNNSYDILKIQGTEAQSYQLNTDAIIAWLKARQHEGSFVVTGAGADWIEARFIKPPQNMIAFARQVALFAPDVLDRGYRTTEKLAEKMKKSNGFYLVWD